jgi:hypothetical protein
MFSITLKAAEGVDPEHLKEFEGRVKIVLPLMKQRYSARAMGIDEGNWSKYLNGKNGVTYDFIAEFDLIFRNILNKEYAGNTGGFYPTGEGNTPYKDIEKKLADLSAIVQQIAAGQQGLEEKIDALLQK